MTTDMAGSPAIVIVRTAILTVMAIAIVVGVWPFAAVLLAVLMLDQVLAIAQGRPALRWLVARPLDSIDQSRFGRHWTDVVARAHAIAPQGSGLKARMSHLYHRSIAASALIAQWSPFVLFGISGPALQTTWILDAMLVATYPLLGFSHYAECRRRLKRHEMHQAARPGMRPT